ncbi:MAG TPA: lysophospholipid acyltransferase family protein [Candidatus Binatia bacterium]|nr:lysophospholipid acyltransferase family protein [Candidatus Binatia bacterium]
MAEPPTSTIAADAGGLPPSAAERLDGVLRTGCALLVLPVVLALASLWAMVLALVGAPRRWIDRVYVGYARLCVRMAGTRLVTHGLEHVEPGRAYVVVANHESSWDPVVLTAGLAPLPLRWVVKRQIIAIPVFGRALLRTGNVRVVRADTEGDVARIRAEMARRPSDVSMIFYAEGTRSRDGALHPFKKGAFVTAISWGLPVLPVGTAGTRRIWRPLTMRLRRGPAVLEVGTPIAVEGLALADRDRLRDAAHAAVRALRARARRRLRALGVEPGGVD